MRILRHNLATESVLGYSLCLTEKFKDRGSRAIYLLVETGSYKIVQVLHETNLRIKSKIELDSCIWRNWHHWYEQRYPRNPPYLLLLSQLPVRTGHKKHYVKSSYICNWSLFIIWLIKNTYIFICILFMVATSCFMGHIFEPSCMIADL